MSENPYKSPACTRVDDISAEGKAYVESRSLGRLVWTVLVFDSILCMLLIVCILVGVIEGSFCYYLIERPVHFLEGFGLMIGIVVCSLGGNILILAKRNLGISFATAGIFFVIAFDAFGTWRQWNASGVNPLLLVVEMIIRGCWLVFYSEVLSIAARRLSASDDMASGVA